MVRSRSSPEHLAASGVRWLSVSLPMVPRSSSTITAVPMRPAEWWRVSRRMLERLSRFRPMSASLPTSGALAGSTYEWREIGTK